jgi:hypothetical protein
LHAMAYYIFLKSLRSLEEFRKNPHVKIPPKSHSTNFQSLGKFKNPIFNSEILFLLISAWPTLRPTRPLSPASPLATPSPAGRKRPAGPSSPCVGRVLAGNTFSFSDHAFPSRPPPPRFSDNWSLAVSFIPHLQPPELARAATDSRSPSAAPRLGCPRTITTSPSFPLP